MPSYGIGTPTGEESVESAAPRSYPPLGGTPKTVRNEFQIWEGMNRWERYVSTRKVGPGGGEGPRPPPPYPPFPGRQRTS